MAGCKAPSGFLSFANTVPPGCVSGQKAGAFGTRSASFPNRCAATRTGSGQIGSCKEISAAVRTVPPSPTPKSSRGGEAGLPMIRVGVRTANRRTAGVTWPPDTMSKRASKSSGCRMRR